MNEFMLKAHAKINLTLDVTGRLSNGYHTVKMIMHSVELHDDITVSRNDSQQITVSCDCSYVPTDRRNLAVRAAELFIQDKGIACKGIHIDIKKRIPVAAGLAGGSTDAAAVLKAMSMLYETGDTLDALCILGVRLGADVPYCLRGGTMLAEGIGDILTPLPAMPPCYAVLCKPNFAVSTAEVYAQMNGGDLPERPDTVGMIHALEQKDYQGICHRLYNVMEMVTAAQHVEIGEIKNVLLEYSADGVAMSGSGPTTYGLFRNIEHATQAYEVLSSQFSDTHLTEICV